MKVVQPVTKSPRRRAELYAKGNTTDIIRGILYSDADSAQYINAAALPALRGDTDAETLANIFGLMQGRINYRADRPGHEIIRGPAYLFETATGDCKSYSVAIGAFCRAFGIPYRYRFTSQSSKDFHHVYVVATAAGKDIVLDAVPDNTGKYLPFGGERPYLRRADVAPGQKVPAGLRGISGGDFWKDSLILFGLIGLLLIFSKKVK